MDDRAQPFDPDELLAHKAWVRALAASLVFDRERVDDVVQETWLAALQARRDGVRDLRAWLGGILRNVVRRQLRGERRRRRRETLVTRTGPPAQEDRDLVAEAEQQRDLVAAVLALDEPYRSTVLALHMAGLGAAELARREGLSPATVRSRHARALTLLRGRLEGRHGDRRAWSLAWLPLLDPAEALAAGAPTPALGASLAATLPLGGVPLVIGKSALALAALVVVAVILIPDEPGGEPTGPTTPAVVTAPTPTAGPATQPPAAPAPLTTPLRVQAPAAPSDAGVGRPVSLSGRVLDADGAALPGATVQLLPDGWTLAALGFPELAQASFPLPETGPLDRTGEPWSRFPRTTSDGAGRFRLDARLVLWDALDWTQGGYRYPAVLVRAPGHAQTLVPCTERSDDQLQVGDVRLHAGVDLSGRVVDPDGHALAGAVLTVEPRGGDRRSSHESHRKAVTDDQGRYRIDGLSTGEAGLTAWAPGHRLARAELVARGPGALPWPDLVLERGATLSGRLADDQGRPVAGALLVAAPSREPLPGDDGALRQALRRGLRNLPPLAGSRTTDSAPPVQGRSDDQGRFALTGLAPGVPHVLLAAAPGWRPGALAGLRPGAAEPVQLTLARAGRLELVLEGDGGAALGELVLTARRSLVDPHGPPPELPVSAIEAPHRWQVDDVDGTPLALALTRDGLPALQRTVAGLPPDRTEALRRLSLPLGGARLSGRVRDARGRPVTGARLHATHLGQVPPRNATELRSVSTHTDAEGRYQLDGLAAGEWALMVLGEDPPRRLAHGRRTLAPGEEAVLDLAAAPTGRLEGRVVDGQDRPRAHAELTLEREAPDGDGQPWRFLLQADLAGRFAHDTLEPGPYRLLVEGLTSAEVTIEAGRTTRLTLTPARAPVLFGRVTANGRPVPGATIELRWLDGGSPGRRASDRTTSGPDGTYELALSGSGPGQVQVTDGQRCQAAPVPLPTLDGRRTLLDLALPHRRLEVLVRRGADGAPVVDAEVNLLQGTGGRLLPTARTDGRGRVAFEHLEAASVRVSVRAEGHPLSQVDAETDGEPLVVELAAGAALTWRLEDHAGQPLPEGGAYALVFRHGAEGSTRELLVSTMVRDGALQLGSLPAVPLTVLLVLPGSVPGDELTADLEALRDRADALLELAPRPGDRLERTSVVAPR